MPKPVSRNAFLAALALTLGSLVQIMASVVATLAVPWAYVGWLVFCFGAVGLCEELGPNRPLNRAGLVLLASSLCARTLLLVVPEGASAIRAELAYAFASIGMTLLWSIALMHRPRQPKIAGLTGSIFSGGTLALLLIAHVGAGGISYLGFSEIFAALAHPEAHTPRAMISVSVVIAGWSAVVAGLLGTVRLKSADEVGTNAR